MDQSSGRSPPGKKQSEKDAEEKGIAAALKQRDMIIRIACRQMEWSMAKKNEQQLLPKFQKKISEL